MSQILVTGAGGYLGGRLTLALSGRPGVSVRALVRRPVDYLPGADQVVLDLLDRPEALVDACAGVDVVVHLAGSNEVACEERPDQALCDTVAAARRIAAAAASAGVRRFVYLSTVHVYGPPADGAVLTETAVPAPRAPYAIARLASEHVAAAAAGADGADVVVLRLTNSVGAPVDPKVDRWTLIGNDLCRQVATSGCLKLRTDGTQWRDFIHMEDACRMIEKALPDQPVRPGTYNVGSGSPMTVRELAELVQETAASLTGERPPLEVAAPSGSPSTPYSVAVDSLGGLGIRAEATLQSAIEETLLFCFEHRDRL